VVLLGSPSLALIEELYRRQYRRFLRIAVASLGDGELARDAVQEAFARAIRGRHGIRGAGTLEAWLWRTLINICRDEQRASLHRTPHDEGQARPNGHAEEWLELRAAVAALPERQRLVLFLRHYADLDYGTIAAAVGVERGTVAATLHAAHTALRSVLTEVRE
jgi:RNA polymerase sigma-70 factor (ECF subfamily)